MHVTIVRMGLAKSAMCWMAEEDCVEHPSLTTILERWRDAERRLERARVAGDRETERRTAVEVAGLAREYQDALDSAIVRERVSVTSETLGESATQQ